MTNARPLLRRTAALLAGVAALAGSVALSAPSASAIPGDGAGPDTPGTSSQISTPQVPVGGRVSFTVTGFPGGETLYIKIDDEQFCQSPPFGACVYHQQKIGANGSVSGSFALPAGLPTGSHTLRFLASEETAEGLKGYTRRSPAFTVVAAAGSSGSGNGSSGSGSGPSGGTGGSNGSGSGSSGSGSTGTTGSSGTTGTTDGGVASVAPAEGAAPAAGGVLAVAPREAPAAEGEEAGGTAVVTSVPQATSAPVAVADEDLTSVPWIGLYVLVGCILASSVISTVTLVRRRRSAG